LNNAIFIAFIFYIYKKNITFVVVSLKKKKIIIKAEKVIKKFRVLKKKIYKKMDEIDVRKKNFSYTNYIYLFFRA
jgi:phage regulator Rha-like protein